MERNGGTFSNIRQGGADGESMMNRPKFSRICRAAMAGKDRYLENTETGAAGRLMSCLGEKAEVKLAGRQETWSRSDCEEFTRPAADYRI